MKTRIFIFLILLYTVNIFASEKEKILFIMGTRPEAIKLLPLYKKCKKNTLHPIICSTGQHKELIDGLFNHFEVSPEYCLNIMKKNQTLEHITQSVFSGLKNIFNKEKIKLVIVQGDTTSAMVGALSAFYNKIPVAHIEAGLRTSDKYSPFPEEINRRIISTIAKFHFAPTKLAYDNLIKENIDKDSIYLTGNTGIDSLLHVHKKLNKKKILPSPKISYFFKKNKNKKIFLLTAHRRESLDGGLKIIFEEIKDFLIKNKDVEIIFPMHPNPKILTIFKNINFSNIKNITIFPPLNYVDLIFTMQNANAILTDSGGIQEEAATLNKPVIILRENTARIESIINNNAVLVGYDRNKIQNELSRLSKENYLKIKKTTFNHVYGEGKSCKKIINILLKNR